MLGNKKFISVVEQDISLEIKFVFPHNHEILNNYWMKLSMISRIIQTEVNVICRSEAEANNIDRDLSDS